MDDNRKKLIQIMLDRRLEVDDKEAVEIVTHLADDEVKDLIKVYTDLDDYDVTLNKDLSTLSPDTYEKIYADYERELDDLEEEKRGKIEKQWEKVDEELDALESANDEKMEEKLNELEFETDSAEKDRTELINAVGSSTRNN